MHPASQQLNAIHAMLAVGHRNRASLEWVGITIIVLGIGSLFAQLPYETMRWTAAVFGLSLPLLALMLDRGRHRAAHIRFGQLLAWLLAVQALPCGSKLRPGVPHPATGWISRRPLTEGAARQGCRGRHRRVRRRP